LLLIDRSTPVPDRLRLELLDTPQHRVGLTECFDSKMAPERLEIDGAQQVSTRHFVFNQGVLEQFEIREAKLPFVLAILYGIVAEEITDLLDRPIPWISLLHDDD
jgi:hypothetical protein